PVGSPGLNVSSGWALRKWTRSHNGMRSLSVASSGRSISKFWLSAISFSSALPFLTFDSFSCSSSVGHRGCSLAMAYLLSRSTASVWARPKRKEKRLDAEGGPRLSVSWQLPFGCGGRLHTILLRAGEVYDCQNWMSGMRLPETALTAAPTRQQTSQPTP